MRISSTLCFGPNVYWTISIRHCGYWITCIDWPRCVYNPLKWQRSCVLWITCIGAVFIEPCLYWTINIDSSLRHPLLDYMHWVICIMDTRIGRYGSSPKHYSSFRIIRREPSGLVQQRFWPRFSISNSWISSRIHVTDPARCRRSIVDCPNIM